MAEFKGIPIRDVPQAARSGEKYRTPQGFTAIKDGIRQSAEAGAVPVRKPTWLRAPLASGAAFAAVKDIVREHRLATVCEEAKCPNIGECWNAGTATIMLMGRRVHARVPLLRRRHRQPPGGWLDAEEPENVARSVELMKLKYVVLTSVDRDDLPDGGAAHYAARDPRHQTSQPRHGGRGTDAGFCGGVGGCVHGHGFRIGCLRPKCRDGGAPDPSGAGMRARGYRQSIDILGAAKAYRRGVLTKTSLMLGLGETEQEILDTMRDLRAAGGVDILTLGQYLRPTPNHLNVERFVTPDEFARYRDAALALGFLECVSGPLVRSSYRAERAARPATTPGWITESVRNERCAPDTPLGPRPVRTHVARHAALHGRARSVDSR